MTHKELEALDEALLYLNEGKIGDTLLKVIGNGLGFVVQKMADAMFLLTMNKSEREKYKKDQAKNKEKEEKEKKEIAEKGYTTEQYNFYRNSIFKPAIEAYKSNTLIEYLEEDGSLDGCELYYLGITKSQYESMVNKFIKNNPDSIDSWDLIDYMEQHDDSEEAIKLFKNNNYIVAGYDCGGNYLLYFFKEKFFLEWDHECPFKDGHVDLRQKMTYQELMDFAKMEFTIKNNNDISNQYVKAAIAADADLGYYRLSTPPKGVKPIKL